MRIQQGFDPKTKPLKQAAKNNLYNYQRRIAKERGILFDLSKDEVFTLIQGSCFYCGSKPQHRGLPGRSPRDTNSSFAWNGIDRLDSNLGYSLGNIVSCCTKCNLMKYTDSVEGFLSHVRKILEYRDSLHINNSVRWPNKGNKGRKDK